MSKAMDALDRLISLAVYGSACVNAACKAPECVEAKTALALLSDYITTTEAVGEVPDDVGALLGSVAQSARASVSKTEGWGFEASLVRG